MRLCSKSLYRMCWDGRVLEFGSLVDDPQRNTTWRWFFVLRRTDARDRTCFVCICIHNAAHETQGSFWQVDDLFSCVWPCVCMYTCVCMYAFLESCVLAGIPQENAGALWWTHVHLYPVCMCACLSLCMYAGGLCCRVCIMYAYMCKGVYVYVHICVWVRRVCLIHQRLHTLF